MSSAAIYMLLIRGSVCMKGLSGSCCRKRLCTAGQPEGGQQWEDRAEAGRDICHWCLGRSCDRLCHHSFGCGQDSSHDPRREGPVQGCCGLRPSDLQRGGLRCLSQGECALTQCLSCNFLKVYGWWQLEPLHLSLVPCPIEMYSTVKLLPAVHIWISSQEPDLYVLCAACWQKESYTPLSCIQVLVALCIAAH